MTGLPRGYDQWRTASPYDNDPSEAECYACAAVNGLTLEQAENCEEMPDGSNRFRCCGCPFEVSNAFNH